jgi:DNA-binding NarL/FixJ family response regulator
MASVRVLLVDDYEPFRREIVSRFDNEPVLRIVAEASDGFEAVRNAKELQPDLILLDIGLPKLNGIEAARQIRTVSPTSKILFVSECRSADIAEAALNTGASGYVVKSVAGRDLFIAIRAVLRGERFLTASLEDDGNGSSHARTSESEHRIDEDFSRLFAESAWVSESLRSLIHASGADFGNVQLFDSTNRVLRIVAQHGFQREFLDYFDTVTEEDASVCGAALKHAFRVVVQDVATDPLLTTESRGVLLRANVRSVQSTPLIDAARLVGMVSTHHSRPNEITSLALKQVDDFVAILLARLRELDQGKEQQGALATSWDAAS